MKSKLITLLLLLTSSSVYSLNLKSDMVQMSTSQVGETMDQQIHQQQKESEQSEVTNPEDIGTIVFGGMGSSCLLPEYQNLIKKLKEALKQDRIDCFENKIVGMMREQADAACEKIKQIDYYKNKKEINLVGQSQGGLMARSVLENCDITPTMKFRNLLTIGTPNMGVSEIPKAGCTQLNMTPEGGALCGTQNTLFIKLAYTDIMQHKLATPGYVRDSRHMDKYRQKSTFLASLNNEKDEKDISEKHKNRMTGLNGAMFVQFMQDEVVYPTISQVFGETIHTSKNEAKDIPMVETEWYNKDSLGFKKLMEEKRIEFVQIDARHTQYNDHHIDDIFIPFLKK